MEKSDAPVTIVAGGSGAIGSAICRKLAAKNHSIALTYRTNAQAGLNIVAEIEAMGGRAMAQAVAVEDANAVAQFVNDVKTRFGKIDSVVYASGPHLEFTFISAITPAQWKQVFDADVNGAFNLLSAALPHLRESGKGAVLAVTTAATGKTPVQDILSAAPKCAIEMLVKGIAKEEGRYGIRANCVAPGFTSDGIGGAILAHDAAVAEMLRKSIPMKRVGTAEDMAGAAAFLLSDEAAYISGQSLAVDGGWQL